MRLFLLLFFYASPMGLGLRGPDRLIVWQVARGEWLTWVQDQTCDHFSLGGVLPDLKKFAQVCGRKTQRLWLPVAKPEHVKLVRRLQRFQNLCLAAAPAEFGKRTEQGSETQIPPCQETVGQVGQHVSADGKKMAFVIPRLSVLILGDFSPKEVTTLPVNLSMIQNLVLANHGRRSGLNQQMLRAFPRVCRVFVSDLIFSKYKKRKSRLDDKSRRLLKNSKLVTHSTSEWGNIHYLLM